MDSELWEPIEEMTKTFIKAARSSNVQIPEVLLIGWKEVNFSYWFRYANSGRNHADFENATLYVILAIFFFFNYGNRELSMSETGPVSLSLSLSLSLSFLNSFLFFTQTSLREFTLLCCWKKDFWRRRRNWNLKEEKNNKENKRNGDEPASNK